jgi:hypothetical protein
MRVATPRFYLGFYGRFHYNGDKNFVELSATTLFPLHIYQTSKL